MEQVPGIDVSRWQGEIEWQKVAAADYRFAIVRATIGDQYRDPRFYHNWYGARDAGLLVSAYHVMTPNVPAQKQVDHFFDVLDERVPDLPLVLDVERDDGIDVTGITACVRETLSAIEERQGTKPIIYTARWFWNRFVLPSTDWRTCDLWVASYTSKPIMPRDWETWRIWQFTESGRVPGVSSRSTDLNWFAGSYEDLLDYAARQAHPATEPAWRARVIIPKLNIRSGPGLHYDDIGDLYEGDLLEVLRLRGDDVWLEFEPGKWAAFALKGEQYMEIERESDSSTNTAPPPPSEPHDDPGQA